MSVDAHRRGNMRRGGSGRGVLFLLVSVVSYARLSARARCHTSVVRCFLLVRLAHRGVAFGAVRGSVRTAAPARVGEVGEVSRGRLRSQSEGRGRANAKASWRCDAHAQEDQQRRHRRAQEPPHPCAPLTSVSDSVSILCSSLVGAGHAAIPARSLEDLSAKLSSAAR